MNGNARSTFPPQLNGAPADFLSLQRYYDGQVGACGCGSGSTLFSWQVSQTKTKPSIHPAPQHTHISQSNHSHPFPPLSLPMNTKPHSGHSQTIILTNPPSRPNNWRTHTDRRQRLLHSRRLQRALRRKRQLKHMVWLRLWHLLQAHLDGVGAQRGGRGGRGWPEHHRDGDESVPVRW